jgi:hypothetical protein
MDLPVDAMSASEEAAFERFCKYRPIDLSFDMYTDRIGGRSTNRRPIPSTRRICLSTRPLFGSRALSEELQTVSL